MKGFPFKRFRLRSFASLFTIALCVVLSVQAIAGCTQQQAATDGSSPPAETLKMGTSADYPPYEFHDTSGGQDKIVGFDVDIANYITEKLGVGLEIQDMEFNGLLPALQTNRVDFVMAGMTPTEERKQNIDFTQIYYEAKNTIVAKTGSNLTALEDLTGKRVGVQLGTIQEEAAKEVQGANVVPLNRVGEIIQEIKSNRLDAAIIEDTVAKGYTNSNTDLEFNTVPNEGESGSAIAFPKGSERVEEFDRILTEMKASGKLEELAKKWFEQSVEAG